MTYRGGKVLSVLLALASAAPLPAFSQVRSAPVDAVVPSVPSALGASVSAPSFSASALTAPALSALPVASLPASAPIAAAPALAAAPAASAPTGPKAASAAAAAPAPVPLDAKRISADASVPGPKDPGAAAALEKMGAAAAAMSSERVPGESAKTSADALFDASAAAPAAADAIPALPAASKRVLGPRGEPANEHPASPAPLDPGPRTAGLRDRVRDQARYWKLLSRSFWWYMFTHIKDMWPGYRARWEKARAEGPVSVSRPRAFFASMRVTGMTGHFYALGGTALYDEAVIAEFRDAFHRWFDAPGIDARETQAFERFMARAKGFNAERRAHTNMYKNIRDPLLKASTMRPDQLAAYFDSLLPPEKEAQTRAYQQSGQMEKTRDAFMAALRTTLAEEDPADPHRIRAAIVLGSFANDAAGPGSDFDVEALANGASNKRLADFSRRLVARWTEAGYHKTNPVTVHDNASWPSWGLVNIVQTRHYIVVSPEPALEVRLSRQGYENPAVHLERGYTARGRVNRVGQHALVLAATFASDLDALLGRKPAPSGH